MAEATIHIDPYLFERHFGAFADFVQRKSGMSFESFASNPYTEQQEGYKRAVYYEARRFLNQGEWTTSLVGSGAIVDAVIGAIELPRNNLVAWQPRYGEKARPHRALYEARDDVDALRRVEGCLFELHHGDHPGQSFADLLPIVGRRYPLAAYLFFLKDCTRYLPIAPTTFERAFDHLGASFRANRRCSWANYQQFIGVVRETRDMLSEQVGSETSLLDAHSFCWILARQMEEEAALPDVGDYHGLDASEREAVVMARVGQGRFRKSLVDYWGQCAVTGLSELPLLRASHIVPWSKASLADRTNLYNGLLLGPSVDAAFDAGYISFDDDGSMIVAKVLSEADARRLGLQQGLRLRRIDSAHRTYLEYHRANVLRR